MMLEERIKGAYLTTISLTDDEIDTIRFLIALRRVGENPVLEVSERGKSQTMQKIVTVETLSTSGLCYLRILVCSPNFAGSDPMRLKHVLTELSKLGPNPLAASVVWALTSASKGLVSHDQPDVMLSVSRETQRGHLEELERMMLSKVRFRLTEDSGIIHVSFGDLVECDCQSYECDHGWSSRFVLAMIHNRDLVIGCEAEGSKGSVSPPISGNDQDLNMSGKIIKVDDKTPGGLSEGTRTRENILTKLMAVRDALDSFEADHQNKGGTGTTKTLFQNFTDPLPAGLVLAVKDKLSETVVKPNGRGEDTEHD